MLRPNRHPRVAQHKFEIDRLKLSRLESFMINDLVDEFRKLLEAYPPWLVITCLVIVSAGLLYVVWRIVKFGIVLLVTALLIALVAFAAWTLFIA